MWDFRSHVPRDAKLPIATGRALSWWQSIDNPPPQSATKCVSPFFVVKPSAAFDLMRPFPNPAQLGGMRGEILLYSGSQLDPQTRMQ